MLTLLQGTFRLSLDKMKTVANKTTSVTSDEWTDKVGLAAHLRCSIRHIGKCQLHITGHYQLGFACNLAINHYEHDGRKWDVDLYQCDY